MIMSSVLGNFLFLSIYKYLINYLFGIYSSYSSHPAINYPNIGFLGFATLPLFGIDNYEIYNKIQYTKGKGFYILP